MSVFACVRDSVCECGCVSECVCACVRDKCVCVRSAYVYPHACLCETKCKYNLCDMNDGYPRTHTISTLSAIYSDNKSIRTPTPTPTPAPTHSIRNALTLIPIVTHSTINIHAHPTPFWGDGGGGGPLQQPPATTCDGVRGASG